MTESKDTYRKLQLLSRHGRTLQGISSLLQWDQETYMPPGAAEIRAEQLKVLAGLIHREKTSKEFAKTLGSLIDLKTGKILAAKLTPSEKAALKLWRRDYQRDMALPAHFVENFAKLCSESIFAWEKAKKSQSFKTFLPFLEQVIEQCRKKADYIGYQDHPYDALLEEYEPGMTTRDIRFLFTPLESSVQRLLKHIQNAASPKKDTPTGTFSLEQQQELNRLLLKLIDYPDHFGRLDLSAHPFSSSAHPTDNRITTRIDLNNPLNTIGTVLHECGHAFYEMGLPKEEYGTPLGDAISLGIHESQSRWWETRIGMSKAFCKFFLPHLKRHYKGHFDRLNVDGFWKMLNTVEPTLIRVDADEVTYPLHVILRFNLEVQLIEGSLKPKEIPEAWNAEMARLLGIIPKNDAEGCLQDIHWSMGGFGYFPTYVLGNLYAAHFFNQFEEDHSDWEKKVAKGEFGFIKDWLAKNIHQYGRRYSSKVLLKKITGKPFSSAAYEEYLNRKYALIYPQ